MRLQGRGDISDNCAISCERANAAVIASGWHPRLAEIEFHALAESGEPIQTIHKRVTICGAETVSKINSRSALVAEAFQPATHTEFTTQEQHIEAILDWLKENLNPNIGSIAVRADRIGKRLSGWSARAMEQKIGGALYSAGWEIDLTNPQNTLRIVALNHDDSRPPIDSEKSPILLWGLKIGGTSPWDERTAPKRPYFKPISLDPRVARAMANLACPDGGALLDPFCGTGGILMEGLGSGLQVFGSDADSRMVWGSRENLEWGQKHTTLSTPNGCGEPEVRRGSATALEALWGDEAPFDGFAFDPPYGRNSWKSDDGWQLFIDALASCRGVAKSIESGGANLATLLPWPPAAAGLDLLREDFGSHPDDAAATTYERSWQVVKDEMAGAGWQVIDFVVIPVHRSLARLLLILKPKGGFSPLR